MSAISICNRALAEIGARATISSFTEASQASINCGLFYDVLRKQLLRTAPWGFARKTLALTTLGLQTNDPPDAPWPWLAKYAYPADCLKMRYILPPPWPGSTSGSITPPAVGVGGSPVAWGGPSRQNRFLIADDDTVVPARTVLLSNVLSAYAVYTKDVTDTDRFDPLFDNALVMALANKLVIPLSGNVAMKQGYMQMVEGAITAARAADASEAIPTTDHVVDWMAARVMLGGTYGAYGPGADWSSLGQWYGGWDNMGWGM